MKRHRHKLIYVLLSTIIVSIYLLKCASPSDPILDYENTGIEVLPITEPQGGFKAGDSVTFKIELSLPHLFTSIVTTINYSNDTLNLDIQQKPADTMIIKKHFAEPDTYYITITGVLENGSNLTTNTKVIIKGISPGINKEPASLTYIKPGCACTLSVAVIGSAPIQYNWYKSDVLLDGVNSDIFIISSFQKENAGVYKCFVSSPWGKDTSLPAVVMLQDTTPKTVFWNRDTIADTISEGDTLIISLKEYYTEPANQTATITFVNQADVAEIKGDSLFTFIAGNRDSGEYSFPVSISNGIESDIALFTVKVVPKYCTLAIQSDSGSVQITPLSEKHRWGDTITLKVVPKNGFVFYQWDGDLSGASDEVSVTIIKDISIIARFWPVNSSDCDKITNGDLNGAILTNSLSANRPKQLCPVPGTYNNGAVKINGGVRFVLQK